jgi:Flp pilus assembly protein TadD
MLVIGEKVNIMSNTVGPAMKERRPEPIQAMAAGLKLCNEQPIINSTSAERARLETFLPLAKEYEAEISALRKNAAEQDERLGRAEGRRQKEVIKVAALESSLGDTRRQLKQKTRDITNRDAEIKDLRRALATKRTSVAEPTTKSTSKAATRKPKKKTVKTAKVSNSRNSAAEAQQQLKKGNLDKAQQLFEQALASGRDTADIRFGLAACYYAQRDLFQARRTLDQLLKKYPAHAQAIGLRGMIAYREEDLMGATDYLQKAVNLDSRDAQLHNYYGIVLHARLQQKPAIREFRKSIALNPDCAEAQYNLAYLLATTISPEIDKSRVHYEAAVRLGSTRNKKLERIIYP